MSNVNFVQVILRKPTPHKAVVHRFETSTAMYRFLKPVFRQHCNTSALDTDPQENFQDHPF